MKHHVRAILFALLVASAGPSHAAVLINDTWQDSTRTDPTAANGYSENGTDADFDGDIESVWYFTGSSGTSMTASPGHLIATVGSGSSSATTYFTPESSPVDLASAGDTLKITWVFTPSNVTTTGTSQNFRLAVVDSPSAARRTSDGSPADSTYAGYAMFMNMATTLGNSAPFQLRARISPGTSAAFLSSSSSLTWSALANGATSGNTGYASGTQYTFVMTFTRTATNGLDITATMTGGSLNNTGSASVSYSDSAPNSFVFDTFGLRPSSAADSASLFDTTLFEVEFIPGATAPSIDSDPDDDSVFVGQDATFNVSASGTLPLFYQWYYNTNSLIASGTNSSLTVTNSQLSDAGGYSALVSNAYGSVTSAVAQLTVNSPVAPSITGQPQDQTVIPGATASFSVSADGSDPLSYQWYFNNSTLLTGATLPTLSITNAQLSDAGSYSVVVNNTAGSATSSNAVLTINTNSVAPVFTTQPGSQVVLVGGTASFTALAAGTAPITYQWKKNGTAVPGATSTSLTLTNVQNGDSGSYTAVASNSVGTTTSSNAVLTVTSSTPIVNSAYNLYGFGRFTTGGGNIATNDAAYRQVYTALDFANAVLSAYKTAGSVKVIEIMNDLDLGWNEVGAAVQNLGSTPFRAHATPQLHPRLITTGVSLIDIKPKSGLTIFSANGATIRHACFNFKSCANVIVRNLKFDELWEWDEASKGNYDKNDWDFIDLGNGGTVSNIWIDHCTFTKSYDGIVDIKQGSSGITFSWCKYTGDDGATNPNSFVWQQINKLESNKTSYAMYNALRTAGFSTTNIVTIIQGHDKTHLVGANSLKAENANHTLTFHHQWFMNLWDRCVPRLRAGNVHNYNIYVDDTLGLAAKRLRDTHSFSSSYSFNPFLNGSISTEGGAILVEKSVYIDCITPLRNNQTDPSNSVYTGKIKALDSIYQFDSAFFRGNSTDPGGTNTFGPKQAAIIPFSWNLPGGVLPYSYVMDDPAQLQSIVTSPTGGAGAGVLTWNKTNWLATSYAPTAPVIVADPDSQTVALSNSVTFTAAASGSAPLTFQWYFNTNSLIANATNSSYAIASVQGADVGAYSVVVSNSAGTATSAYATLNLTVTLTPFETWQYTYFGCTNSGFTCGQAALLSDPDGDGLNNEAEFLSGSDPTNSASGLRIISVAQQSTNIVVTWQTAGGKTNILQATSGDANGGYRTNDFADVGDQLIIPGAGDLLTNQTDWSGTTNVPSRFYRIRLVP
jgi:pectate lyase